MNLSDFRISQKQSTPPTGLSPALQALWFEARGDWEKAHELAQKDGGASGDWVHAYLHRKEGDASNARYWYGRAKKPVFAGSLDEEWAAISEALLMKGIRENYENEHTDKRYRRHRSRTNRSGDCAAG